MELYVYYQEREEYMTKKKKKKNRYYGMSLPKSLIISPMSLMKHEVRSSTKSEEVVEN